MQFKLLIAASLLGSAIALPGAVNGGKKQRRKLVTANFDDLTAAPLGPSPVDQYQYLNYDGLSVGTPELMGVQLFGVTPRSPPNVVYSDAIPSTFAGPSLKADYDDSRTKAFDLRCFYYACVAVPETAVATAENCTVTVTGYRDGVQVAIQDFIYDQDNVLDADLNAKNLKGTFSSDFKGLDEADITYVEAEGLDTAPSFIGDNFKYVVYLKGKKE